MRLMSGVKWGVQTFAIGTLAFILPFGVFARPMVFARPIWMSMHGECKVPCPKNASSHRPPNGAPVEFTVSGIVKGVDEQCFTPSKSSRFFWSL